MRCMRWLVWWGRGREDVRLSCNFNVSLLVWVDWLACPTLISCCLFFLLGMIRFCPRDNRDELSLTTRLCHHDDRDEFSGRTKIPWLEVFWMFFLLLVLIWYNDTPWSDLCWCVLQGVSLFCLYRKGGGLMRLYQHFVTTFFGQAFFGVL